MHQGHNQVPRAAARLEDGAEVGALKHQAEAAARAEDDEGGDSDELESIKAIQSEMRFPISNISDILHRNL